MHSAVPRIIIAGAASGCGKTTVVCALLQALVSRGLRVAGFKCGPDYIDTMFHRSVIGVKSANLDPFFFDGNTLNYLLSDGGKNTDISIIEGVMGYYDGICVGSDGGSTQSLAARTESPAVLVVDAKGASRSLLAAVHGFFSFSPDSKIRGVIFNRCSPAVYASLKDEMEKAYGTALVPLGYLPCMDGCSFDSRRLGLVTAQETQDLREKLQILARQAELTVDIDGVMRLAAAAPPVCCAGIDVPSLPPVRIAVARDRAFCFYYEESLALLEKMGAELVPFSPIDDAALPESIDGLYLGGGYPELHAEALSRNTSMLRSVKAALDGGLPCIAECGGFMYLNRSIGGFPAVGFLPGRSFDAGRLVRFGYVSLKAKNDNMLCRAGKVIRAHEFHYWDCDRIGDSFTAQKASSPSEWECVVSNDRLFAGFPHFHFYSDMSLARSFCEACFKVRGMEPLPVFSG